MYHSPPCAFIRGSAGVNAQSDSTSLKNNSYLTINVTGAGASAMDSGGGVAS